MDTIQKVNMDQLLQKISDMQDKMQGLEAQKGAATHDSFAALLKDSINKVNDLQQNASKMAKQFEMGNPDIQLTDVMLNLQKASLSFQAMTQVRNKLVSAYQDIMNMQI